MGTRANVEGLAPYPVRTMGRQQEEDSHEREEEDGNVPAMDTEHPPICIYGDMATWPKDRVVVAGVCLGATTSLPYSMHTAARHNDFVVTANDGTCALGSRAPTHRRAR